MARAKVAPTLRELVAHEVKHRAYMLPTHAARAEAELRALFAVVKAADAVELRRAVHVITGEPRHRVAWLEAVHRWQTARVHLDAVSNPQARRVGGKGP